MNYTCDQCQLDLDESRFSWIRKKDGSHRRVKTCKTCRSKRAYAQRRNDPVRYAALLDYQRSRYKKRQRTRTDGKRKAMAKVLAKHGLSKGTNDAR